MKLYTSYFYNIRFFKPWMIPLSTAAWDPKWFHNFNGQDYIWKDKNGVWEGLRMEELSPISCHAEGCPCKERDLAKTGQCQFLTQYRDGLEKINFEKLVTDIYNLANYIKSIEGFQEEPVIVLIVYEVPSNPCSERKGIQDLFLSHGIDIEEWKP